MTAWVVERDGVFYRGIDRAGGTIGRLCNFTQSKEDAMRFARKQDAERFIDSYFHGAGYEATEYEFGGNAKAEGGEGGSNL